MKKITLLLSIASLLLMGTGCEKKKEEKPKETFKSVDYYDSHQKEAMTRDKECKSMNVVKTEAQRIDCKNADIAVGYQELRDLGLLKDK